MSDRHTVFVETSARLHLGVLDLRGGRGRWFGGLGAAAPAPTLLVSAEEHDALDVEGPDAERAAAYARRFMAHHGLEGGLRLRVHRALPQHSGLGSGTQLALAVARAIAELRGIRAEPAELARATGRARRSAVGTWTFAGGGLVVEGGRRPVQDDCGPLLARLPFPEAWRCVVVVPEAAPGVSGGDEEAAFEQLPIPPEREVERVAHLVLMGVMPAVLDADIGAFGRALTEIQDITGQWFASVQGGTFATGASAAAVRRMRELGAAGVGQSSWGPAVYGIVEGQEGAAMLAEALRRDSGYPSVVYEGVFPAHGARVWRG